MRFGVLDINPARNPAILDTATWDPGRAARSIEQLDAVYWQHLREAAANGQLLPSAGGFVPHTLSCTRHNESALFLASLGDGQQVFVEIGGGDQPALGVPLATRIPEADLRVAAYAADAAVIDRFIRTADRSPRALGPIPRLGVGTRMTTAIWPGTFGAMEAGGFCTNAIQNSVREVNLLASLLAGQPPDRNYAFSFGTIESGYTGSSFEGLWVSGVLEGLKHSAHLQFGADADHIQVKRGAGGLERAKQVIAAARYYTFFTLDVSDVLDYAALDAGRGQADACLAESLPDARQRQEVFGYHGRGEGARPDQATFGRLVGKYWHALGAVQELAETVGQVRGGHAFDLELSIDEHPPEIETMDCLTSDEELRFVLLEAQRRGLALTHVAPNFGVEKGTDYRCPDGLDGLERRMRSLVALADEFGVLLDVHSGDDLSAATRRVIRRASGGRLHFKVSPMLQQLFAEVLEEHHPALFSRWWDDTLRYARREAEVGSTLAVDCIRQYEATPKRAPSAGHSLFHHYGFGFVGQRDGQGQFLQREEFYSLSDVFYRAYQERVKQYVCQLAEELL